MRTVWQALKRTGYAGDKRQTGEPVRRHSRLAGREGGFFRPIDRNDVPRLMIAAERFERTTREKGKRNGELGSVAIEVLREMLRLVNFRTGRLEPSIATLCGRLKRSKDAIVRALANLRTAGFLDWIRRYEPTGNEGRGVQVRQISNAYRIVMPPRAAALLGRAAQPAPPPDDDRARRHGAQRDHNAMLDSLPLWQLPGQLIENRDLADTLARIGRTVAERESARQEEFRLSNIISAGD